MARAQRGPGRHQGGDPYTRCPIVVMNGIEVESIMFSHQFARHTDNPAVKRALALSRRAEQMQQKADNWLLPGSDGPLETTIVYEQVAVDLTQPYGVSAPTTTTPRA
jgi:hypothetical protein